jgi:hypothetical protein
MNTCWQCVWDEALQPGKRTILVVTDKEDVETTSLENVSRKRKGSGDVEAANQRSSSRGNDTS